MGLSECLGVLRLEKRSKKKSINVDDHIVAVVPLADENRVAEPEAAAEGAVYHCTLDAVHESDMPQASGVSERWPQLKPAYFKDPEAGFKIAPSATTKSLDEKRKRRSSAASSASSLGGGAAAAAGDGIGKGGLADEEHQKRAVGDLQKKLENAKGRLHDAEQKLNAAEEKLKTNQKLLNSSKRTAQNRKDANDKLDASGKELKGKINDLTKERDHALGSVQTSVQAARDAKSAEKNLAITKVKLELKDAKLRIEHQEKRLKAAKKTRKRKKSDNERSESSDSDERREQQRQFRERQRRE